MKRILFGSISRFIPQIFLEGDEGGGGGGGDAAPPAADPASEFDGFAPPALSPSFESAPADPPAGDTPPADPAKPPAKPAVDPAKPPVDPKKGKAGAPQPKAGDGTPAALRAELDTLKKEKATWEESRKTEDPRIAQHKTEADGLKTKLTEAEKKVAEYEERLLRQDPSVVGKLREFDEAYQKKAGRFYTAVPDLDQTRVHALTLEYAKLPFNSPEFKAANAEFEAKVNLAIGGTEEKDSRNLDKTLDFIRDNLEAGREKAALEKEVYGNARKLAHDGEVKSYQDTKTNVAKLYDSAMSIPEGLDDPLHPKVALKLFDEGLEPKQVEAFDKDIKAFVELVFAGPAPRSEADFAGMKPEEIQAIRTGEMNRAKVAREHAVDCLANGLRVLRRFPSMLKEIARLRAKVGEESDPPDPDPAANGGDGETGGDGDLKNFQPRSLADAAKGQF